MGGAANVAQLPFQIYTGQFTAPLTQEQQQSMQGINAAAGFATPFVNTGANYAQMGAQPITADQINAYMNPEQQDVISATEAQFADINAQQQSQLQGNAAAQGALGGDRTAVAQSVLSGQQQMAQAPVIAGLESQAYTTALAAAQQDAARQLTAAGTLGTLGTQGASSMLAGSTAGFGAGTTQQQTEQAQLNALYNQFLQQQAYPFQTEQWLAGIQGGIGPLLGGTSATSGTGATTGSTTGTTTGATTGQTIAGQTGVGTSTTSQPMDPYTAALGAAMVAGSLPYSTPTTPTQEARGGRIPGFDVGGAPMSNIGYVPRMAVNSHGAGLPPPPSLNLATPAGVGASSPSAPPMPGAPPLQPVSFGGGKSNSTSSGNSLMNQIGMYGLAGKGIGNIASGLGNMFSGTTEAGLSGDIADAVGSAAEDFGPELAMGLLARGGPARQAGFGTGSMMVQPRRGYDAGGDVDDDFDDSSQGYVPPAATSTNVPMPRPRPDAAPVAAQPTSGFAPAPAPPPAAAQPTSGFAPAPAPPPAAAPSVPAKRRTFFGLGPEMTENERLGMLAAGLGMMGNRTRNPMQAIAAGGMQGMGVYLNRLTADQAADKLAQMMKWHQDQLTETARHNVATEKHQQATEGVPPGFRRTDEGLEAVPGGPHDPGQIERETTAKQVSAMTNESRRVAAYQLIGGDMSWTKNIGRGAQAGRDIQTVRNEATQILMNPEGEYRLGAKAAAEHIGEQMQRFNAQGVGLNAGERTLATREANLGLILRVTHAAIPAALEASEKVARLGWRKPNEIIQAGQVMTDAPELKEFGMANLQLAEGWARAMNPTGVMRESDRDLALDKLSTAENKQVYARLVAQLEKQINREIAATRAGRVRAPNATPAPGADEATGAAPAAPAAAAAPQFTGRTATGPNGQKLRQTTDGKWVQ